MIRIILGILVSFLLVDVIRRTEIFDSRTVNESARTNLSGLRKFVIPWSGLEVSKFRFL